MKRSLLISALAVVMIFSAVALASGDVAIFNGASGSNTVDNSTNLVKPKVTVNPKVTLTVTTPDANQEVLFGTVDPGGTAGPLNVTLEVDSNKAFTITSAEDLTNFDAIVLNRTLTAPTAGAKGQGVSFTDTMDISVPWSVEPGAYDATVQYTVTQN